VMEILTKLDLNTPGGSDARHDHEEEPEDV
jgi:hypothetical protein